MRSYSAASASASSETEGTRQRGAGVPIGREIVGLQVAHDLQAVLEPSQEPVGIGERRGVGVGHVALERECPQRRQRVRRAQPRVAAPVHDLQQLHRELDVADAAPSALDLGELLPALADVLLEANLRASHVVDRGRRELRRVHERRDALDEPRPQMPVARDRAGLDHGLALPGRGLALVVGEGRLQGAAEGPGPPAWPECDVDAQRDALGGRSGEQAGRGRDRVLRCLLCIGTGLAMQEQQVDVARVVQLVAPELAEPDHGEGVAARRRRQGCCDARVGDRADLRDHRLEGRS